MVKMVCFANDIAEKVRWAINNPEEAQRIGKQAQDDVAENFSLEVLLDYNLKFYKEIIK